MFPEKKVYVNYFSDDPDEAIEVTCHPERQVSTRIEVWEPDIASFNYTEMSHRDARGVWELAYKYANERESSDVL